MSGTQRTWKYLAERGKALRVALAARDDEGDVAHDGDRPRSAHTAVDVRDLTIKRLESELADEKERSASLGRSHDEQKFRTDVLERSYAKQLADARDRAAAAEQALDAQAARLETLETEHAEAIRLLAEARAMLRQRTAPAAAGSAATAEQPAAATDADLRNGSWLPAFDGSMTINELIGESSRARAASAPADSWSDDKVDAPVDSEASTGDMLPPDSMLPARNADDD